MAIVMHPRLWARLATAGGRSPAFVAAVLDAATAQWEADSAREMAEALERDAPRRRAGRPLGAKTDNPSARGAGWQGEGWLDMARADLASIYGDDWSFTDDTRNDSARDGLGHAAEPLAASPAAFFIDPPEPAASRVPHAHPVAAGSGAGAVVLQFQARAVANGLGIGESPRGARGRAYLPSHAVAGPVQLVMPWAALTASRAPASLDTRRSRAGPGAGTLRAAA
jgi:hypothetical protein